jgi:biopolymer transport protein ExbB
MRLLKTPAPLLVIAAIVAFLSGSAFAQQETPVAPSPAITASPPATPLPQAQPGLPGGPQTPIPVSGGEAAGQSASPTLPHDLSPWGMFMAADIVVKAVMIGLAFASLVTWTVWLAKSLELFAARTRAQRATAAIVRARSLGDAVASLAGKGGPAALFVQAARQEAELSEDALDHADGAGLKERVASRLGRIEAQASRRMTRGTGLLATIGSTAPFVGLFGTVWGIMNAFIGISEAQTTNLAVVAPGIAEALLATALGLVAAIPAVVIYNAFARAIAGYRQVLADASAGVERLVSRDLDYRSVPRRALAAE